jgi:hypothetical protein
MCEDFAPNFGNEKTGCCIMTMHRLTLPFSPGNFSPKTDCHPHPPYFSVSPIEDTTERQTFDTTEVMEAESQMVLNTLTEHDFQDEFKMAEALGTVHMGGREQLRG